MAKHINISDNEIVEKLEFIGAHYRITKLTKILDKIIFDEYNRIQDNKVFEELKLQEIARQEVNYARDIESSNQLAAGFKVETKIPSIDLGDLDANGEYEFMIDEYGERVGNPNHSFFA